MRFDDATVTKIYAPGIVPRALYWLAFQAPFAYATNRTTLEAAMHRRNLAFMLTEYWYGASRVARATGVTVIDGRLALSGERLSGYAPVRANRLLLRSVADAALLKLPRNAYERTGLRGRIARPVMPVRADGPASEDRTTPTLIVLPQSKPEPCRDSA